jgi:hypothetical protein
MKFPISSVRVLVFLFVVALAIWAGQRSHTWHHDGQVLVSQLLETPRADEYSPPVQHQSWDDLPPVVQSYFRRVFFIPQEGPSHPSLFLPRTKIRSLRMDQKGKLRMQEWSQFHAHQTASASPKIGFVWEAAVPMHHNSGWPAVQVRHAWVGGETVQLRVSLAGIISLQDLPKSSEDEASLLQGESMLWLAEAFLIPTALLPQAGLVDWKRDPLQDKKVHLRLKEDPSVELDVTFPDNDTIVVEGLRQKLLEGGVFEARPWFGIMSGFETVSTNPPIWTPTHMEAGWKDKNGKDEYYFVGDNYNIKFEWAKTMTTSDEGEQQSIVS